jgi:LDH2 family malate/lactate/ureidoglycolate dehydrogenase
MMMDIFGGLLSGAAFPGNVVDMNKSMSEPQNVGHWFLVFRPEVFLGSKEEYLKRMDEMIGRVRGCEKAADVERIYTSGEIEAELEVERREGIPYTQGEIETMHALAKEAASEERLVPM